MVLAGETPPTNPIISIFPTSLGFGNVAIDTTSTSSYLLSASDLTPTTGNLTVTPPSGYQVSVSSGSGFSSSITVAYNGGALAATTIYVRFSPTASGNYAGNITNSGGGATTQNVAVTGTGVGTASPPTLAMFPTSLSFGNIVIDTISPEQSYVLMGSNLTPASGNISITAPNGFQVSSISGSGFATTISTAYTMSSGGPKIMPLGDSITELDWEGGYRSFLYKLLIDSSFTFDYVGRNTSNHVDVNLGFTFPQAFWDHEGYVSATIDNSGSTHVWNKDIVAALTANPPDIMLIMLGVNDIWSGVRTATQVRDSMSSFLDQIWSVNPSIKVILSNLSHTYTGNTVNETILTSYNALLPALVAAKQAAGRYITLVDNYSALNSATDVVDGIHPSVQGYHKMAAAWYPAVAAALKSNSNTFTKSIYVRFSPVAVQSYSGSITNAGGGATSQNVVVTGAGISVAAPVLTVTPTTVSFGNVVINNISNEQTYVLSGSNLLPANGNITITAPAGFQVSSTTGSGFDSSITISYTGGTLSAKTIRGRFLPTVQRTYSGNITNTGGGAIAQNVSVSGNGVVPTITVIPSSLPFGGIVTHDTSDEKTYTLSGLNFTPASGNIIVTAPSSAYQVSLTTGSGFGPSVSVPYSGGTISSSSPVTIFVRFLPTVAQSDSGNITNIGGGAATQNVSVTGIGKSLSDPLITTNPTSLLFDNVTINTISPEKTYTLSGLHLTPSNDSLTITAPAGFSISTVSGSGFTSSKRIAYTSRTLSTQTIYVRFSPTAVQDYSNNITNAGGGATAQSVYVSGNSVPPTITVSPTSLSFGSVLLNTSSEHAYTLSGSNLQPANDTIRITATNGFAISTASGSGFTSSINISYTTGNLPSTTIYVRFFPTAVQNYSGNIINVGGGATSQDVTLSGTGVSAASLSISSTSLSFGSVTTGGVSGEKSYALSGTNLIAPGSITITSSRVFQVSATSGAGFDSSISISYSSDTLSSRSIYVRFSPTVVENYSGNIINVGGGAPALDVAVSGSGLPSNVVVQLGQNFPNPFNSSTRIPYSLYKKSWVKLTIFNILGQRIGILINEEQDIGFYQPAFDLGRINNNIELPSGTYFYRLDIAGVSITKKFILLK
jgi:lysophospholipase L1-like esterase